VCVISPSPVARVLYESMPYCALHPSKLFSVDVCWLLASPVLIRISDMAYQMAKVPPNLAVHEEDWYRSGGIILGVRWRSASRVKKLFAASRMDKHGYLKKNQTKMSCGTYIQGSKHAMCFRLSSVFSCTLAGFSVYLRAKWVVIQWL